MSVSLVKKSLDLVSADDRSAQKNKPNLKSIKKKKPVDGKKNAAAVVDKIRQQSKQQNEVDKVESNVQRLLKLSQAETLHKKLEHKLIDKVTNSKHKKECKSKKQQSAFTEEDFANFEREYFVNGCY